MDKTALTHSRNIVRWQGVERRDGNAKAKMKIAVEEKMLELSKQRLLLNTTDPMAVTLYS
jgi:hypothetical protein